MTRKEGGLAKGKKKNGADKKVPKTIAGVRVPKELRKAGHMVLDLAESPLAREIVAASFMAAVTAVASSRQGRAAVAGAADEAGDAAADAARKANIVKVALAAAGSEAGRRLLDVARGVDGEMKRKAKGGGRERGG